LLDSIPRFAFNLAKFSALQQIILVFFAAHRECLRLDPQSNPTPLAAPKLVMPDVGLRWFSVALTSTVAGFAMGLQRIFNIYQLYPNE